MKQKNKLQINYSRLTMSIVILYLAIKQRIVCYFKLIKFLMIRSLVFYLCEIPSFFLSISLLNCTN